MVRKTIERAPLTLYTFDELDDDAQAVALAEHRNWNVEYADWSTEIISAFSKRLEVLGFMDIDTSFSGFGSQGDGASFTFRARFSDLLDAYRTMQTQNFAVGHTWDAVEPLPFDLERYAVLAHADPDFTIQCVRNNSRYMHEQSVDVVPFHDFDTDAADAFTGDTWWTHSRLEQELDAFIEAVDAWRIDVCRALYNTLEREYEDLTSDECVGDSLMANDMWFTIVGETYND